MGTALLALLLVSVALPAATLAVPRPGESCPDVTPAPGATKEPDSTAAVCGEGTNVDPEGGGSPDLGGLLPILAAMGVGGGLALVAAFLVLRRRAAAPAAPADPGEWWTCRKCGSTNVIGSPRCYACGSWQS
jgi:hypothetical protein